MVLPPAPLQQPSPRGVAPLRPSHSPGPARQGRAGLGPRTSLSPVPSAVPPVPAASGGEGVGSGPIRPSNFLQVHSHAPLPFDAQLPNREGPCPPLPLPPGYIRSRRSRPQPPA